MIRENNQAANRTWTWEYDEAGNILNKKEYAYTNGTLGSVLSTVSYGYPSATSSEKWKDLLLSYNGSTITYDTIGNPLSDGTWSYEWRQGRQLVKMSGSNGIWRFAYDADGMRTQRTNGIKTYNYVYSGSLLRAMTVDGQSLIFRYGVDGRPYSVRFNNADYFYVLNLQGDVIGIVDGSGNLVVRYTYDAWGNILSTTGSMASTLGYLNPLRYRSYVYDQETGFYYLQSRYYNPEWGRFLNADSLLDTSNLVGLNLFAYCINNPVNYVDRLGTDPGYAVAWISSMWWLTLVDGPVPAGDIIYIAGIVVIGIVTISAVNQISSPIFREEEQDGKTEPTPPEVTYPGDDPTVAPDGYEWTGPDEQGGKRGGYKNPNGKDSWHPDLDHPDGVRPHWDYNDKYGHKWRIFPDGFEFVK